VDSDTGKPIYMDDIQLELDAARRKRSQEHSRAYDLSVTNREDEANRRLVGINRRWEAAKARYIARRAENPVPEGFKAGTP
jgi:hypothetical protein